MSFLVWMLEYCIWYIAPCSGMLPFHTIQPKRQDVADITWSSLLQLMYHVSCGSITAYLSIVINGIVIHGRYKVSHIFIFTIKF